MQTGNPVRALCCGCGNLAEFKTTRQSSQPGLHCMDGALPATLLAADDTAAWARCVITRKCAVCKVYTSHAFLRGDDDPYRDVIEEAHQVRCIEGRTRDPQNPQWDAHHCGFCLPGLLAWWDLPRTVSSGSDGAADAFAAKLGGLS